MDDIPLTTRVSRITIGRLHNLGNYEHIRYEISVEVAPGNNPALVLSRLENILNNLRVDSGVSEWDLRRAKENLAKSDAERSDNDRYNLTAHQATIYQYENAQKRMALAREAFQLFGGVSVYTDAKQDWDDDEYWG
jgi:hypothetical protein